MKIEIDSKYAIVDGYSFGDGRKDGDGHGHACAYSKQNDFGCGFWFEYGNMHGGGYGYGDGFYEDGVDYIDTLVKSEM